MDTSTERFCGYLIKDSKDISSILTETTSDEILLMASMFVGTKKTELDKIDKKEIEKLNTLILNRYTGVDYKHISFVKETFNLIDKITSLETKPKIENLIIECLHHCRIITHPYFIENIKCLFFVDDMSYHYDNSDDTPLNVLYNMENLKSLRIQLQLTRLCYSYKTISQKILMITENLPINLEKLVLIFSLGDELLLDELEKIKIENLPPKLRELEIFFGCSAIQRVIIKVTDIFSEIEKHVSIIPSLKKIAVKIIFERKIETIYEFTY